MAKQENSTSSNKQNTFNKGLYKDVEFGFIPDGAWTHARNAVHNTEDGEIGVISNERSNTWCQAAPYTIIGAIHLYSDKWAIFSTNNSDSEIGLFEEDVCSYTTVVNDRCLGFSTLNLIKGAAKENSDCTWQVYWDDSLNPSRTMNMDEPPFKKVATTVNDCITYDLLYPLELDCEELRIAKLVDPPCVKLNKLPDGGTLVNGTYQVFIAYTIDQQRVTDYIGVSNIQSLFSHDNGEGSLEVTIEGLDQRFDQFELGIIVFANEQTEGRRIGFYDTRTTRVVIDYFDNSLTVLPTNVLPISNPAFEKAEAMYAANGYLFRVAPTGKFDFNYQPIANNIVSKWVSVEYDTTYYYNGGNVTGYLRDEQYSFFIRWVYNTGDKSASYHIPGRAATANDLQIATGNDALPVSSGTPRRWQTYNTASPLPTSGGILPDGGVVIQEGKMGYWESTEDYPDDRQDIWGALCGKPIRHHKFPEECNHPSVKLINDSGDKLRVLGVKFENIKPPVDNQGNLIPGIIGYEILRGTRDGNKSIVAKGIINNMGEYEIPNGNGAKALYPNYPYNDLRIDPFLSSTETKGACLSTNQNYTPTGVFRDDEFTFHSPDTGFKSPFLSPTEFKIYGEYSGQSFGGFDTVEGHPKNKIMRDTAFFLSLILGTGYALTQMGGKKTTTKTSGRTLNIGLGTITNSLAPISLAPVGAGTMSVATLQAPSSAAVAATVQGGITTGLKAGLKLAMKNLADWLKDEVQSYTLLTTGSTGLTGTLIQTGEEAARAVSDSANGSLGSEDTETTEETEYNAIPSTLRLAGSGPIFVYFMMNGADRFMEIITNLVPYQQYAYHYKSHGYYSNFACVSDGNRRRLIEDSVYLRPGFQEFALERINNLFRSKSVAIKLEQSIARPSTADNSRWTIGNENLWDTPKAKRTKNISAFYGGLKYNLENQYGQLANIRQVPVSSCVQRVQITSPNQTFKSDVLFGGDTYVGRYTEKNTFFYFYNWMLNEPNGTEFDYSQYINVAYPRYWMDTEKYDFQELISGITSLDFKNILPSDKAALDVRQSACATIFNKNGAFVAKKRYMYLFNSGVRDFWVESEVNLALRDHADTEPSRFYDEQDFTDLDSLFRPNNIKVGNFWKYDYSLSISKYFGQNISWAHLQTLDYDPTVSEECYVKYPNRVIYSLPAITSAKKDGWRVFLPLNVYDFKGKVTTIKEVNETGSIIMFNSSSPVQFRGVDTLKTDNGIKITVGDGGLFANPPQRIVNADSSYEYASCQDHYSVISTPSGIYWASQNQGKLFLYAGQVIDLGKAGMKWWLSKYLPYRITKQYPGYQSLDNPVDGVGVQATYDNTDEIVYFSKKDFEVKPEFRERVIYLGGNTFKVDGMLTVKGGDSRYFDNASWTLSFDPKTKEFVSFHDWHPYLNLPSKNHFLTTYGADIYLHNDTCSSFCNFYGTDYPFEIEVAASSGGQTTIVRSVEYHLEAKNYKNECRDTHHILDSNFDRAIVHNSEQVSGMLNLNITPKNNAPAILTYPRVNLNSIDILFSKEEGVYRFNQFYDITDDRGEFTNTRRSIFLTEPNGYIRPLNTTNMNYAKAPHQHKKFRHDVNKVLLIRTVSGSDRLSLKLNYTKLNLSMR